MLKKLAIASALVYTGYCLNHIDYFVACAKHGWNNPDESVRHPLATADKLYEKMYNNG